MQARDPGSFGVEQNVLCREHGGAGLACATRITELEFSARVLQHAALNCSRRALEKGRCVPRGWSVRTTNGVEAVNAGSLPHRRVHTVVVLVEGIARGSAYLEELHWRAAIAASTVTDDPDQWLNLHASAKWRENTVAALVFKVQLAGDGMFLVVVELKSLSTAVRVDVIRKSCPCGHWEALP